MTTTMTAKSNGIPTANKAVLSVAGNDNGFGLIDVDDGVVVRSCKSL